MSAVESFGAGRDDIQGSKFKKYRGKTGNTDRVGIIYYEDNPKTMFKGVKSHFKDRFFVCKSSSTNREICCLHSYDRNKPEYRVGCALVKYELRKKDGKTKLASYEVLPWIFSAKMYHKIDAVDGEFKLVEHDLNLACINEDFQTIEVTPCKESIWQGSPDLKKKIIEEAEGIIEDVGRNLASDLSLTEIRELLGIDAPGSEDAATDIDLGSVVEDL